VPANSNTKTPVAIVHFADSSNQNFQVKLVDDQSRQTLSNVFDISLTQTQGTLSHPFTLCFKQNSSLSSSHSSGSCGDKKKKVCLGYINSKNVWECQSSVNQTGKNSSDYYCGTVSHLTSFALLLSSSSSGGCSSDDSYWIAALCLLGAMPIICFIIILAFYLSKNVRLCFMGKEGFANNEYRSEVLRKKRKSKSNGHKSNVFTSQLNLKSER